MFTADISGSSAMNDVEIESKLLVDDVMRRWPATIAVFLRHQMACVGCPVGPFHTIAESIVVYGIPVALLLEELRAAVRIGKRGE
jgi:hybrid cluster-associated redox disulfide protein